MDDLSDHPVHKHYNKGDDAVTVPGVTARFQLARQGYAHMMPSRVTQLGYIPYVPSDQDKQQPRGMNTPFVMHDDRKERLYRAFTYT
jgi:hypothetical protein